MMNFSAPVLTINTRRVVLLPTELSDSLPTRGQVMATGLVNGKDFHHVIEPDGRGGHWLDVTEFTATADKGIKVSLTTTSDWPEPAMPPDVAAIIKKTEANATWQKATPRAHWEWLRWINATANPDTRAKRLAAMANKLAKGMRRPCCFNLASCTVPAVAKNGKLDLQSVDD